MAFSNDTEKVLHLQDGDIGILCDKGYRPIYGPHNQLLNQVFSQHFPNIKTDQRYINDDHHDLFNLINFTPSSHPFSKGEYDHFMLKEIHDQKDVLANMINKFCDLDQNHINLDQLGFNNLDISKITHIHICGCGSAYYASRIGIIYDRINCFDSMQCRIRI